MAEAQERTAGDLVVKTFPPAFGGRLIVEIQTIDGASIAEIDTLHSTKADKEIAAKIVKRFNGYPKAIEALKLAKGWLEEVSDHRAYHIPRAVFDDISAVLGEALSQNGEG